MLSNRLAPRFEVLPEQPPSGHSHSPIPFVTIGNCINELSLLSRLWHELNALPAHDVDAGAEHLLMRLCQLVQASHAQWHLDGISACGARHRRATQQWPMGIAWPATHTEHEWQLLTHSVSIDANTQMVLRFYRQAGMPAFSAQHIDLLSSAMSGLHRWLQWLALSHGSSAETSPLPTHLRKVLLKLITGQSEKQIASALGVSTNTTHQYVTAIYRLFGVRNRASLMEKWLSVLNVNAISASF
jgi:ATP/maltotriose-dependent transcriptional regulator MalT